ncbi:sirohydrochlorin chelatase [Thermincola potens]|uniref:Cobalamin (Vitamin B12) biosynthesis CbiX protein n=1 Tax=Thermincola potens (strain JR) TaxID=635013 RepID=D5XFJ4_THEPJ|nr:CbiX/SirB N-terminal domain-containing protein [Thermincola potens]ADG82415.1 cobalamin (vitamin B12) biosynthesis CbiX protein [Thermincola potens JR]
MDRGIIILGHGSKAPEALETLKKIAEMVRVSLGDGIVEIASLQFNKPDLPEAIQTVIAKGARKVIIIPLFLYNGIHMQEDIPAVIAEQKDKNPGVEIVLAKNLGADDRIVGVLLDRIKEVS